MVDTNDTRFTKRVSSRGEIFSQSKMDIVHFGLANAQNIKRISVRWRNGETVEFTDKAVNQLLDTNAVDPKTMTFKQNDIELRVGAAFPLTVNVTPANANRAVAWSSNNTSAVTVDDKGVIRAQGKVGESAVISAMSVANKMTKDVNVVLVDWHEKPVEEISILSIDSPIYTGERLVLDADILPIDADNASLAYTSSDPSIASVDNRGLVTAISPGEAVISVATLSGASAETSIRVEALIMPFVEITNANELKQALSSAQDVTVKVKYHAGSGNSVISSDEGGCVFGYVILSTNGFQLKTLN